MLLANECKAILFDTIHRMVRDLLYAVVVLMVFDFEAKQRKSRNRKRKKETKVCKLEII